MDFLFLDSDISTILFIPKTQQVAFAICHAVWFSRNELTLLRAKEMEEKDEEKPAAKGFNYLAKTFIAACNLTSSACLVSMLPYGYWEFLTMRNIRTIHDQPAEQCRRERANPTNALQTQNSSQLSIGTGHSLIGS